MKLMTRLSLCGLLAALGVVVGSTYVQAQDTVSANSGDWSDTLNWNGGVPTNNWAAINSGHTLDVTPGATVGLLDVGGTGNGNLTIAAGADLNAVAFRVGYVGGVVGNVTQTGGTVSANGGFNSPFLQGEILIGDAGNGTWTISDGTLTAQDEFLIGFIDGGEGTLNVQGGTVNATRILTVGVLGNGTGNLNVSGGTVNANIDLLTSLFGGTTSTLTQSGGTINVGQHFILGVRSSSTFTQTGGDVNVNGVNSRLTVAEDHTSASYDLQDGSITSTHIFLGDLDSSHGTLKVSGGSIDLRGNLSVGGALASNAPPAPVGTQGQALDADGTLIVSGPDGTIDVAGNLLANPGDNSRFGGGGEHNDSLLVFEATGGGVSTIDVAGIADLTGAVIDFNLLSAFPLGSTFDLITATSISSDYVQNPSDVGIVSLAIVGGGNGQILRATLVPEPSSLAMVALAFAAAMFPGARRRLAAM